MKRLLYILIMCASAHAPAQAQSGRTFTAVWQGDSAVTLRFPLTAAGSGTGKDYALCLQPIVTSTAGDTLRFDNFIFRGQRNARLTDRARFFGDVPPGEGAEYALTDTVNFEARLLTRQAPWLTKSIDSLNVALLREKEGCCEAWQLAQQPVGRFIYMPPFVPEMPAVPDNTGRAGALMADNPVLQHISKYRPYTPDRVLRKEKGALYVHFPLDRTELHHDFRDNAPTLDRIIDITRQIMADTTSSVKLIQIIGLASPEGPLKRNLKLGGGRADALKRYIMERVPETTDALFECANGGEGWAELRDLVADSEFEGREALLDIIDNTPNAEQRERLMKQLNGGRTYSYVKQNLLADQRNSGYLRIYFDYVPDSAAAVINQAIALTAHDTTPAQHAEALKLLRTVAHDERAQNALGTALYLCGEEAEAERVWQRAARLGDKGAAENLRQALDIKKRKQ